jgi:hypothetical protein
VGAGSFDSREKEVNRRGFLFGAVAVPVGGVLSKELAAELSVPAPDVVRPKEGDRLIVAGRGAVLHESDLRAERGMVTIVRDDGSVLGSYLVTGMDVRQDYIEMQFLEREHRRATMPYGPQTVTMEMRRMA